MKIGLCVKYLLFLSDFNEILISSTDFSKNSQKSNLIKIRPVRAELFHAGIQADRRDEVNSRSPQFCEGA
jgi:hypothetical protein